MCGISGVLSLESNVDIEKIIKMNDAVKHRGPNDEGYYIYDKSGLDQIYTGEDSSKEAVELINKNINQSQFENPRLVLSHRRLSIIDLSVDGFQPMVNQNKILVYNGEIYNYIEIKQTLMDNGVLFKTNSDSEVLLKAYSYWGEDCVNYFDGMWSFAIWDKEENKLFCCRDRFGEKPFFYYFDGKTFIFGSEIKQILEYGIKFEVNNIVLNRFIKFSLLDIDNETFFSNIYSLLPAHNLTIKVSDKIPELKIRKYYELATNNKNTIDFDFATQEIGKLLERSINYRLRSDVRVGSCLSGGLDSSSIVTLASKNISRANSNTKNFDTFTAVYDDSPDVDERYYSDIVVNQTEVRNHQTKPTAKILEEELDRLLWHQEQPIHSFSVFAGWMVMKEAKNQKVTVLLDGQGGDETLLGYSRLMSYFLFDQLKSYKLFNLIKSIVNQSAKTDMKIIRTIAELIYFNLGFIRNFRQKNRYKGLLKKNFNRQNRTDYKIKNLLTVKTLKSGQEKDLNQLLTSLLRYEDRNAMAHSIETRLPFLSKEFVDFCYSTPGEILLKNGWSKSTLRNYMSGKMSEIVTFRRRKLGFAIPEEKWMTELESSINKMLNEEILSENYFNVNWVKKNKLKKKYTKQIFKFFIVEKWMRVYDRYS